MAKQATTSQLYGLLAEFDTVAGITHATEAAAEAGYRKMDAHTPFPIEEVMHALHARSPLPWLVLTGGLSGATLGHLLLVWANFINYPLNIGGRPLYNWPHFVPITFECGILLASFTAFFSLWTLCGFPLPHHPLFTAPNFEHASDDRFFLCIEARDPKFDRAKTEAFLQGLGASRVSAVES